MNLTTDEIDDLQYASQTGLFELNEEYISLDGLNLYSDDLVLLDKERSEYYYAAASTGVMLSTLWNQSGVAKVGNNTTITYNQYCPYVSGTQTHSVTGCTNTAAGQIIYYFIEKGELDLQLTLNAEDAYTDGNGLKINADGSTPGTVSFSVINSKLSSYDINSADDAAALVYACGVVQKATYANSTSTAWRSELFYRAGFECVNDSNDYYNFAGGLWGTTGNISEGGFEVLIENLTAGRVVGTSYPGHALVIDGYDAQTDKFHINFGWGNSSSTRWYTRAEMNAQGYYHFVYDLMVEGEKDFFVTDSRIYGTGTLARAFELAQGTIGANTITFDNSVAGESLHFSESFMVYSSDNDIVVNNFNMDLMIDSCAYGFYSQSTGEFNDFSGALIVNDKSRYGFYFFDSLNFESNGGVIFVGDYKLNGDAAAGSEAILASLRSSQKNNTDIADFVINSWSGCSIYASKESDTITLTNNTIVVGSITLNSGDDILTVTNNSHVYGYVSCDDGNDVVTIDSTSSISGIWYGKGDLKLILTGTPDDDAMFFITDYVYNFQSQASVSADITGAVAGSYTLIEADENLNYLSYLNSIVITVNAGLGISYALSVNGTSDCDYAELLRVDDSLVLRVKGFSAQDKTPPSVPSSLTAMVAGNSVALDWGNSSDNNRVDGYYYRYGTSSNLSGDGTFVRNSQATLSDLANGTYYYQVRAKDASGNYSNWSMVKSFTINYIARPVTVSSGGMMISSAIFMTDKQLKESVMNISSGGSAVRTTLSSGAVQNIYSSGIASDTRVSSGGFINVSMYGNLNSATFYNGGSGVVSRTGSASNVVISNGGKLTVSSGGYLSGADVKNGGTLALMYKGNAANVIVSSGATVGGFTFKDAVTSYSQLQINNMNVKNAIVSSGMSGYIYSGARGENLDVANGGYIYVYSGGTATISYNPWQGRISSASGANITYLSASEKVYYGGSDCGILSSGAVLSNLSATSGQQFRVLSGGLLKDASVLSGGTAIISSGGRASAVNVSSGGYVYLYGGTLTGAVVNSSGYMVVSQGELQSTTIYSGGSVVLYGSADKTTVSGGRLYVQSGAAAGNIQIHSGGWMDVYSGGTVGNAELFSGGSMTLYSGALVNNASLNSFTSIYLSRGEIGTLQMDACASAVICGSLGSAIVGSRSFLTFYSGGTAEKITVNSAGRVYFEEGTSINNIAMERGAVLAVVGKTQAQNNITINGTLRTHVLKAAVLDMQNYTLTLDLQNRNVSDAYVVDNLANVVNAKLAITVSATQYSGTYEIARGAAEFSGTITVNCGSYSGNVAVGASLTLGKSTYTLSVNSSGYMHLAVENSGTNTTPKVADYVPGTWSTDWAQASKYAKENNRIIFACYGDANECGPSDSMKEYLLENPDFLDLAQKYLVLLYDTVPEGKSYGGSPAAYLLDGDGNSLVHKSGFTQAWTDAWMTWLKLNLGVISGIYSIESTVKSYAASSLQNVTSSLYVAGVTLNGVAISSGGSVLLMSGGAASNTKVYSSGYLYISSGGIANNTQVNSGGFLRIFSGGTAASTQVYSSGYLYISSGGIANNTQVNSGGYLRISSGGAASNTKVYSSGYLYISTGGIANNTQVNSGGCMVISSGGTAQNTTVKSEGVVQLYSAGVISGMTVSSGGKAYLRPGTEVTGLVASAGAIIGFDVAPDTYFQGSYAGNAFEVKDGKLLNYAINSGCHVSVCSGGSVNSVTVNSAGKLCVLSNGNAAYTEIDSGGNMYVNGGTAANTEIDGRLYASSGGIVNNTTVNSGGLLLIYSSGTANSTVINHSGNMYVSSGGYAQDAVVSGYVYIAADGAVSSAEIASGGRIYLGSNSILKDAEVQYGGILDLRESASVLRGNVLIQGQLMADSNRKVDVSQAKITVDLSQSKTTDAGCIINLDSLNISSFAVTVSAYQETGTYKLAQGAAAFTGTITVGNNTLSIGGTSVKYNNYIYSLSKNSGILYLTLENAPDGVPAAPQYSITPSGWTNSQVTVTAKFGNNSTIKEYSYDSKIWYSYTEEITVKNNCTIYLRAGNSLNMYSEITSVVIDNIDKQNPVVTVTANTRDWTRDSVTLTAVASDSLSQVKSVCYSLNGTTWVAGSSCTVSSNGIVYFRAVDNAGNATITQYNVTNIDRVAPTKPVVNVEYLEGKAVVTADFSSDSVVCLYSLDNKIWQTCSGSVEMTEPGMVYFRSFDAAGNESQTTSCNLTSMNPAFPVNLQSSEDELSWKYSKETKFELKISSDSFQHVLAVKTTGSSVDLMGLPQGTYQWQVGLVDADGIAKGKNITASGTQTAQKFVSDADGDMDIFFACADDVWDSDYVAAQRGFSNGWSGTGEQVELDGKNRISSIFAGSTDADILVLSDDTNGDALFVEDIYSALGDQARLSQIDEIRAGAGDDVVDMTSQRFSYLGDGVKICGGDGNDTIWANNGNNTLFGDAGNDSIVGGADNDVIVGGIGNDSMHGGGGQDIFCFGENWGKDTVEQLADGEVILWFENGSESNWNALSLTYTDGANSVKVIGVARDNITLRFGDSSLQYDELASAGCFDDLVSKNVFEDDKYKKILA